MEGIKPNIWTVLFLILDKLLLIYITMADKCIADYDENNRRKRNVRR